MHTEEKQEKRSWVFSETLLRISFKFTSKNVVHTTEESELIKRSVVSISVRLFDPFETVSTVTILFKVSCQQICEAKLS